MMTRKPIDSVNNVPVSSVPRSHGRPWECIHELTGEDRVRESWRVGLLLTSGAIIASRDSSFRWNDNEGRGVSVFISGYRWLKVGRLKRLPRSCFGEDGVARECMHSHAGAWEREDYFDRNQ